jgi:hypothetical protein
LAKKSEGGEAKSNNRKIGRFGVESTFNCPSLKFIKTEKRYAPLSYRGEEKEGFFDLQDWAEIAVMSLGAGSVAEAGIRLSTSSATSTRAASTR